MPGILRTEARPAGAPGEHGVPDPHVVEDPLAKHCRGETPLRTAPAGPIQAAVQKSEGIQGAAGWRPPGLVGVLGSREPGGFNQ